MGKVTFLPTIESEKSKPKTINIKAIVLKKAFQQYTLIQLTLRHTL